MIAKNVSKCLIVFTGNLKIKVLKTIDIKARKRVAELYKLTDEITNASNEINEIYANKIYRKYRRLIAVNAKLKKQLSQYHCRGCKCAILSNGDVQQDRKEEQDYHDNDDSESSIIVADYQDYQLKQKSSTSSLTSHSIIKRCRNKKIPRIICDIEDTDNFDGNDNRFTKTTCDNNYNDCHEDDDGKNINNGDNANNSDTMNDENNKDKLFMVIDPYEFETTNDDNQSEHEIKDEGFCVDTIDHTDSNEL
ncbi:unnamed protein product [Rotaria sp. Silwood1]|nr:unnamed protein product [Rotaria sp. Silwood1]